MAPNYASLKDSAMYIIEINRGRCGGWVKRACEAQMKKLMMDEDED